MIQQYSRYWQIKETARNGIICDRVIELTVGTVEMLRDFALYKSATDIDIGSDDDSVRLLSEVHELL